MKIFLIRHAIAEKSSLEWQDQDDERPLTRAGIKAFRQAIKGIRKQGLTPQLLLTSPVLRALHTANWLMAGLRQKNLVLRESDALRRDRPARLPDELLELSADAEVVLIGHAPHLIRLASYLLSGHEELRLSLKKGGMLVLTIEDPTAAGTAVLHSILTPRQLRLMA